MTLTRHGVEIVDLDDIRIVVKQSLWEFARSQRSKIDVRFTRLKQERPLWNGRVLLLHSYRIHDKILDGRCFETDYASLTAWRDWHFPDPLVYNFWTAAALRASDGAYLVGEMAPHPARGGELYFPNGTPETTDILDGHAVDLQANLGRELLEETSITVEELEVVQTWRFVRDENSIAPVREVNALQNAYELSDYLASDPQAEFSGIHILRDSRDLNAQIPL